MPPVPICPKHKNYQGKRCPKNGCSGCQDVYDYLHGILHPKRMKQIDAKTMDVEPILCKKHPKYKGKRKPKTVCEGCIAYYNKKHGIIAKKPKSADIVPPPPLTSEPLEIQHSGPWALKKSGALDAHHDFICTRPSDTDIRNRGEKICGSVSFFIVRRNSDIYFKCTFCGRQYRAEARDNELYYTQEPIIKNHSRLGHIDGSEDSETMNGVPKEPAPVKKRKRKVIRKK